MALQIELEMLDIIDHIFGINSATVRLHVSDMLPLLHDTMLASTRKNNEVTTTVDVEVDKCSSTRARSRERA